MKIIPRILAAAIALSTIESYAMVQSSADPAGETERINRYLNQRGLNRLSIRLAEIQLARELNPDRRSQMATKLSRRYRDYFLANISLTDNGQFVEKAERLIKSYPEIETPHLRLAVSHASYLDAESKFLSWWQNGAQPRNRDAIATSFRDVQQNLERQIRQFEFAQEKTIAELPYDDAENQSRQRKLNGLESRLVHAHYLAAWSNYFLAVLPAANDSERLRKAHSGFYRAMQIEQDKPIDTIDSKWLDFSSPLSHRTLLGLAMVYSAQQKFNSARFCFENANQLSSSQFEPDVWHFNSLAFAKHWESAIQFAEKQRTRNHSAHSQGSFWKTVTNAGFAIPKTNSREATVLQRAGLLGLLRAFDAPTIKEFVVSRNIQLTEDTLENLWIKSLLDFQLAGNDQSGLKHAKANINSALELAQERSGDSDKKARMQYLNALIEFRLGNSDAAVEQIRQISNDTVSKDPDLSESIAWLKCRSLIRLGSENVLMKGAAIAAINNFIESQPNSRLLNRVEFEKTKITSSLLPAEEAIAILQKIRPSSRHFAETQFEIIKNHYRLWEQAIESGAAAESDAFARLIVADEAYRALSGLPLARRISSLMYVTDAALRGSTDSPLIYKLLSEAELLIADSDTGNSTDESQVMYYQFMAAKKFGKTEKAKTLAYWLFENSDKRMYQVTGLAFLANTVDDSDSSTIDERIAIYQALTMLLGTTTDKLGQSKNARVAATRLVELYLKTGEFEPAKQLNNHLLATNPNQQQYLLDKARIEMMTGQSNLALPVWRKIARASQSGSDLWLEAKLGIVNCLIELDSQSAGKVLRQTVNLAGELSESWTSRIEELENKLESLAETIKSQPADSSK